jgi:glutathione S-transferase
MADVYLVPQVFSAGRFKVDLSDMPIIRRIAEACDALPAFAEAHPSRQPDAE